MHAEFKAHSETKMYMWIYKRVLSQQLDDICTAWGINDGKTFRKLLSPHNEHKNKMGKMVKSKEHETGTKS